jgi:hypothetical protein
MKKSSSPLMKWKIRTTSEMHSLAVWRSLSLSLNYSEKEGRKPIFEENPFQEKRQYICREQ